MNIELRIDELVLRGFASTMRHEIRAALERELGDLLAEEGVAASLNRLRNVSRLDAGSIPVKSRATGQAIGVQLAQSVYRGILR